MPVVQCRSHTLSINSIRGSWSRFFGSLQIVLILHQFGPILAVINPFKFGDPITHQGGYRLNDGILIRAYKVHNGIAGTCHACLVVCVLLSGG